MVSKLDGSFLLLISKMIKQVALNKSSLILKQGILKGEVSLYH
jgi:hypothetical protein